MKQAKNQETGEEVAIKILDKEKIKQEDLGESIKKEISFENNNKHEEPPSLPGSKLGWSGVYSALLNNNLFSLTWIRDDDEDD